MSEQPTDSYCGIAIPRVSSMTPLDIAPPPATCPLVAPFLPSLSPTVPTGPSPGLPLAAPSIAPIISPQTTPGFLGAPTLSPAGAKPTAECTDASTPRLNSLGLRLPTCRGRFRNGSNVRTRRAASSPSGRCNSPGSVWPRAKASAQQHRRPALPSHCRLSRRHSRSTFLTSSSCRKTTTQALGCASSTTWRCSNRFRKLA